MKDHHHQINHQMLKLGKRKKILDQLIQYRYNNINEIIYCSLYIFTVLHQKQFLEMFYLPLKKSQWMALSLAAISTIILLAQAFGY